MGAIRLRESSVMEPEKESSVMIQDPVPGDKSYNWRGEAVNPDWSYSEYMRRQDEIEENSMRFKKVGVITIQDDN